MKPLGHFSFPREDEFVCEHICSVAGDYLENLNRAQLLTLIQTIANYHFSRNPLPAGLIDHIQLLTPEGAMALMDAALNKARWGHTE